MSDPLFSSAQQGFRLERHGPLAELVLSRPACHNAFDADLMLGLLDCLDDWPSPRSRACDGPCPLAAAEAGHFCRRRPQMDAQPGPSRLRAQPGRCRVLARLMQTRTSCPSPRWLWCKRRLWRRIGIVCACDCVLASEDCALLPLRGEPGLVLR